MNNIIKLSCIAGLSCLLLVSFNAQAADKIVSQEVIQTRGLKIEVKGLGTVKIKSIRNTKEPSKPCSLNIPVFTRYLESKKLSLFKNKDEEVKHLEKLGDDPKYGTVCGGEGAGCLIIIQKEEVRDLEKLHQ